MWAGLQGDLEPLEAFREQIREALTDAGLPSDERPFRPHLTITYRYDRRIVSALDTYSGPAWIACPLTLVDSRDGDYHRVWSGPLPTS